MTLIGGACIGVALALIGYLLAGLPGELVGIVLTFPASMTFTLWAKRR